MAQMVITVIGNDRAGLVAALAEAVTSAGANWERSRMAELAGQFAGIVLVTVPDDAEPMLRANLDAIHRDDLLHVSIRTIGSDGVAATSSADERWRLRVVAQDHTGIVQRVSQTLAEHAVSIDDLETEVVPAPMGGRVFQADAALEVPPANSIDEVRTALESLTPDLMVDLEREG